MQTAIHQLHGWENRRVDVPCNGCTLCCKLMTPLYPEDDIASYEHGDWVEFNNGKSIYRGKVLARHPNGDCIYLNEHGCSIYERRPRACGMYDCRETFKNSDRAGRKLAIKRGEVPKAIFERGRELLGC